MKRFFLAAAMLLLAHFGAQATVVTNTTGCPIIVKQVCYNAACNFLSSTAYAVPAFSGITITATCPAGSITVYEVCWAVGACKSICTSVEASPWPGCGPGVYTNTLSPCPTCSPTGGNVTYDLVFDTLDITP